MITNLDTKPQHLIQAMLREVLHYRQAESIDTVLSKRDPLLSGLATLLSYFPYPEHMLKYELENVLRSAISKPGGLILFGHVVEAVSNLSIIKIVTDALKKYKWYPLEDDGYKRTNHQKVWDRYCSVTVIYSLEGKFMGVMLGNAPCTKFTDEMMYKKTLYTEDGNVIENSTLFEYHRIVWAE